MPRIRYKNEQNTPKRMQYTFLPPIRLATSTHDGLYNLKTIERRVHETSRRSDQYPLGRSQRFYTRYKKLLFAIASSLTSSDITDLKSLCRNYIQPTHHLDDVHNSWSFIILLENKNLLAVNSLVFLQTLLYYVGRTDLYELVFKFRVDRQKEYKSDGVEIRHMLEEKHNDPQRMKLTKDMLEFRRTLKKSRRNGKTNLAILQQKLSELSTKVQNNINEMNNYKCQITGEQEHIQSIQTHQGLIDKEDVKGTPCKDVKETPCKEDVKETPCTEVESDINEQKNSVDTGTSTKEKTIILHTHRPIRNGNQNTKRRIRPTKKKIETKLGSKSISSKTECFTQLGGTEELPKDDEYFLSEEAVLAETPMPPPHKDFTMEAYKIYEQNRDLANSMPIAPSKPKQNKDTETRVEQVNVPLKIKQIRSRFRKDNLHKMKTYYTRRRKEKTRKKEPQTTSLNNEGSVCSDNDKGVKLIFPDIYEKYARTSRLQTNAVKL